MPGNPFRVKPFRGGIKRASPKVPRKPNPRKSNVPRPASANGTTSRRVATPEAPRVKVTSKGRHGRSMPPVKQGAQLGTPGRHG